MDDKLQKTLLQLESGRRQLEQFSRQAQMIEAAIAELAATVEALNTLKDQKPGVEVMMPVGAGSYVRGALKDTGNVLVGIGADMSVERKIPGAVQVLEDRKKKLMESLGGINKTIGEMSLRLGELNQQAERMLAQTRQS